jgi:hypothetical protein
MKAIALLLGFFVASPALSETLDVSTLSPYEQNVHRFGWCSQAWRDEGMNNQPNLETYQIGDIVLLLSSNGFTDADNEYLSGKAGDDLQAQLITGSKILNQKDLDACFEDLKNILTENYVPNFKYMEN